MHPLRLLLTISFIESLTTVFHERGVYFYTTHELGYSETGNLLLAVLIGLAYAGGAMLSHAVSVRTGEKKLVVVIVASHVVGHLLLWGVTQPIVFFATNVSLAFFTGMKWPVIESYVSAGRTPRETARAVGLFNMSWATAVPTALLITGPVMEAFSSGIFLLAAGFNVVTLALLPRLPSHPVHLALDHPERLAPLLRQRYTALLTSARWSLLSSYTLMFLLVPLMPTIFQDLGVPLAAATALAAMMDVTRVGTFWLMRQWAGWHGRASVLAAAAVGLPATFYLVLLGPSLPVVLAGELFFGISAGLAYFAALYYAMVVKDASVEAGGAHEGLIGLGFAAGPAAGLVGKTLAKPLGGATVGMIAGTLPVAALFTALSLRPLLKLRRPLDERRS